MSPTAYLIQVILHEMIHAGRRQGGSAVNDGTEEDIVWELTYGAYKAVFGDKEPPASATEGVINSVYDRVLHKLTDGDLCR